MRRLSLSLINNILISGDSYFSTSRSYSVISCNTLTVEKILISEGVLFENSVLFSNPSSSLLTLGSVDQLLVF